MDVFLIAQQAVNRFPDVGIEMHGIDELRLGKSLRQSFNGFADILETFAEVLAPMPCDQHKLLAAL